MLSILSSLLGIASSSLPNLLSFFQQKSDQKHELAMAKMQNERELAMAQAGFASQEKIAAIEYESTLAETYTQEREALYAHDMKLMDKASQDVVDLNAKMRPYITFAFVGLLIFVDIISLFWVLYLTWLTPSFDFFLKAIDQVFSTDEMAIVSSIIGFYFGSRQWEKHNEGR
jgi:hypothetical protein